MPDPVPYPDQFVSVKGIRTRFWKAGTGRRTIVLVHGFTGSAYEWIYNIPSLQKKYTVIALDLPGHGRTDKPRVDYDYDFFAVFLNDFFITMGISKAVLFGHSMGGIITMYFCIKFSAKVEQLVSIAPAFGRKFPFFINLLSLPVLGEHSLRPPSSPQAVKDGFRPLTYKPFVYEQECIDCYYEFQHSPGYVQAMLTYVRGVMSLFGLTRKGKRYARLFDEELPKLEQPHLLVWGKQDRIIPLSNGVQLRKLIPNVDFWEIDECGHCPHYEYFEDFNRRVVEFLEG